MMYSKQLLLVIGLSTLTFCFVFVGILFIPFVRQSAISIFTSYNTTDSSKQSLAAGVIMASPVKFQSVPAYSSTTDNSYDPTLELISSPPPPPVYKYKFLRSVDECTMNKMGKDGYQAVQFGGNMDTSTGHSSADCTKDRVVDVMDWVLFVRQD